MTNSLYIMSYVRETGKVYGQMKFNGTLRPGDRTMLNVIGFIRYEDYIVVDMNHRATPEQTVYRIIKQFKMEEYIEKL